VGFTRELLESRRDAADALDGPMPRLVSLTDTVRTRKPRRVDWVRLYILVEDLRYQVSQMTTLPNPDIDENGSLLPARKRGTSYTAAPAAVPTATRKATQGAYGIDRAHQTNQRSRAATEAGARPALASSTTPVAPVSVASGPASWAPRYVASQGGGPPGRTTTPEVRPAPKMPGERKRVQPSKDRDRPRT
jgi:hypothetical protein